MVIPALGPGYAVTSQGPLQASQFASDAPDPSAAAGALSTLGKTITTYERVWQADGGLNQVQNLLVRFPNPTGAQVFLQAAQHSLESGEIVSSDPVASIPGARRVTYFAATNEDGVGEAITMGSGVYVDLLSFFSAASGNAQPISPANAETVARAQYKAMTQAPGGASSVAARSGRRLLQEDRLGRHHPGRRARGRRAGAGRGHTRAAAAAPERSPRRPFPWRPQAATRFTISANTAGEVTGSRWPESTRITSTGGGSRRTMTSCMSGRIGRSLSLST